MLRITEIYESIQGESIYAGWPCVFIRLTGCPLRCRWCDTVYSFEGGEEVNLGEVSERVQSFAANLVELTGGEPLAQPECVPLMHELVKAGKKVLIETGGSEAIENVPEQVHIIMDIKCPDSQMSDRNRYENIDLLKRSDEVKFVVASRNDFDWAVKTVRDYDLIDKCQVAFSPAFGLLKEEQLVNWILEIGLNIRLNMQIHKYIWSPRTKGV